MEEITIQTYFFIFFLKNPVLFGTFQKIGGEGIERGNQYPPIISAPSSTKNREKKRDPDAHQTKKGNTWHFGYKGHIDVDKISGLVHHVEASAANVHDVTVMPLLLHGEEESVHGDSGYLGAEKREDAIIYNNQGQKIQYKINRRPSQSKDNSARSKGQIKRMEREKSSVRAKVEHVFGIVKGLFGYRKTRYKGRRK